MKRTPDTARSAQKPTRKQLQYLRSLAAQTATTFTAPRDRDDASAEIDRLLTLTRSAGVDRAREQRAVQRDLAERPSDATRFRRDEIAGYGSTARWTQHRSDDRERS